MRGLNQWHLLRMIRSMQRFIREFNWSNSLLGLVSKFGCGQCRNLHVGVPGCRPPKVISDHFCRLVTDSTTTFPQSTFEEKTRWRSEFGPIIYFAVKIRPYRINIRTSRCANSDQMRSEASIQIRKMERILDWRDECFYGNRKVKRVHELIINTGDRSFFKP